MFENYSPAMLRKAVEIELQSNKDPKTAAIIAMRRLEDDPEYYTVNYGVLEKARKMPIGTVSKGRKKIAEGKWIKVKGEIKKVQDKPKDQIDTPEFKAWFGNSKVVDSSGKPLVVYHGTNKDFKEFSKERINSSGKTAYNTFGHGFYFTNVPEIASGYSSERKNSNIIPVFLSIKNPYIVKSSNKDEIDNLRASGKNSQYIEELKDKNYDGIFVINDRISSKALNKYGKQPIEFIAFSPTQIKSATGNQGTFDPNNPDMTKARPTKYIKKIIVNGKPRYFYTQQQIKEYQESLKEEKEKKSSFNLFTTIKNLFGFKDEKEASKKVQDDYKNNELDKRGVTWDDWKNHLSEYLKNKDKWDAFFSKKPSEKKPPAEPSEKKEKGEKKETKKTFIKLSLMKLIHGLYGNVQEPVSEQPIVSVPKESPDNFDTMPESEGEGKTLQSKFDKWKSGDLSGIEGSQFDLIQELTDGKVMRTFFDRVIIKKVANGFVSHIDAEGSMQSGSGGISEKSFIRMLNNGSAVPVGLEKETITLDDGAKIETNVDLDDKQKKEESDNEEIASREGYFNEKPAEILNAGDDVWGAARHNFDTYEKVNVDVKLMEENGTAPAYVTKKNLLGKNGLSNKDERVKNGESEFKVMASYLIKEYLPTMPVDSEESRSNYMKFIRAIVRLDNDTTKAVDYIAGLSDVYANMFPDAVSKESNSEAQRKKRSGKETVGDILHVLFTTILQVPDRYTAYSMDKRKVKMLNNLTHAISGEKTGSYTYNDIMEDVFGKVKLTGIKMKKGDTFVLTDDMKEKFYAMTSEYRAGFSRDDYIKEREALDDKVHQLMYLTPTKQEQYAFIGKEVSVELINSEIRRVSEEKTRKLYDKYLIREKIYPETKGQVIKIGKNEIQVAFPFPDGKIRSFKVKPSDVKPENVDSIKKEVEKEKSARINLEVIRKASRKGGKSFDKISPAEAQKMLEKDFKMKAVQYGNSMPDKERIAHTKWTLEALSDLSELLNIPMEQVSVNGKLGIGFGARGKPVPGISGGAAAHYESGTKMINLTRANGIGTLAHEWGHFIDNIMTPSMQGFLTENVNYKSIFVKSTEEIPPGGIIEVKGKRGKVVRYCLDPEKKDSAYSFAKLNEGQSEPSPSSDYVRFKFYKGEVLLPEKESTEYESIAKQISKKSKEWMQTACKEKESSGQDFSHISGSPYYNAPTECFARAFEAYIADKLAENGRDNTYLASTYRTISSDGYLVYPQGEYRKEINRLFDQFFDDLRNSGELKKAIMKLSGKTFFFRKK